MSVTLSARQHVLAASIVEVLADLGHKPVTPPRDHNVWYHSPLRTGDSEPSFHVDAALNLWHDFGPGEGGTVIELAMKLMPRFSYPQIVAYLQPFAVQSTTTTAVDAPRVKKESPFFDIALAQLTNPRLLTYCTERGIPITDLLKVNAPLRAVFQQATYRTKGKPNPYTSLAWPNAAGGTILKGPPSKPGGKSFMGYAGDGSFTFVKGLGTGGALLIFEAMFDALSMLSALTNGTGTTQGDLLILNSTSNAGQTLDLIKRYPKLHLFLDNDNQGNVATAFYEAHHPAVVDERHRFSGYADVNDALTGISIEVRKAEKQAARGTGGKEPEVFEPGRETSRWWLAVKWVTPQPNKKTGELMEWMPYYSFTNELSSLNELKKLRSKLVAQGKISVSHLCQRVEKPVKGGADYTILEKQVHVK